MLTSPTEGPARPRLVRSVQAAYFLAVVFGGGYLLGRDTERRYLWPLGVALGLALGADVPQRTGEWLRVRARARSIVLAIRVLLGLCALAGVTGVTVSLVRALWFGRQSQRDTADAHHLNAGTQALLLYAIFFVALVIWSQRRRSARLYGVAVLGCALLVLGVVTLTDLDREAQGVGTCAFAVGAYAVFSVLMPATDRPWLSFVTSTFLLAAAITWVPSRPVDCLFALGLAGMFMDLPLDSWEDRLTG
jgi:hypothetical protein